MRKIRFLKWTNGQRDFYYSNIIYYFIILLSKYFKTCELLNPTIEIETRRCEIGIEFVSGYLGGWLPGMWWIVNSIVRNLIFQLHFLRFRVATED